MVKQESLLRLPDVQTRVGLKRSQIYVLMERGLFPRPLRISRNAVAWRATEIGRWIEDRIADPRGQVFSESPRV